MEFSNWIAIKIARLCVKYAAVHKSGKEAKAGNQSEEEMNPLLGGEEGCHDGAREENDCESEDCMSSNASSFESDRASSPYDDDSRERTPLTDVSHPAVFKNFVGVSNPLKGAFRAVKNRVKIWTAQARDATVAAIEKWRKLGFLGMAKATGEFIKAHPWETAAGIILVASIACTPVIPSCMRFTASGIAAGSAAAAIQSGIGSVVAGSAFAVAQSAMMGGYGVFIFLILPAITTVALLAFATLKRKAMNWMTRMGYGGNSAPEQGALAVISDVTVGVAEFSHEVAKVLVLGVVFCLGTAVYRWRRWSRGI